jgi:O-antigen/teichoic acid export membrane protein
MTGYYEMANRAVTQFRAVIVAAYQMLVPYMAHRAGKRGLSPSQIAGTYRAAQRLLVVLATAYFAVVTAALPLILTLWRGRFNADFVRIGLLCAAGWLVNTLGVTAYMLYLATGQLRWTVWTHIVIGLLNVVLAGLGGWLFGGLGVVGGAMLALSLGSMVVVAAFHREFEVPWREFLPGNTAPLALSSLSVAFGLAAAQLLAGPGPKGGSWLLAVLAVFALGTAIAVWLHPAVRSALSLLRVPEASE